MVITVSIVTGFQNKIREKVIGFGSHLQITNMEDNTSMESSPLQVDSNLIKSISSNPNIKHLQTFAYKPAILQSESHSTILTVNNLVDTVENKDVLGVLFKGIDKAYDMVFFKDKLIKGSLIDFSSNEPEVIISSKIAMLLQYEIGDQISAYFVLNNTPKKRNFTIKGIYKTGLEEFDKKIIFTNISALQSINNWGVKTAITVIDTCINNEFVLKGLSFGNTPPNHFKWNEKITTNTFFLINGNKNVSTQFSASVEKRSEEESVRELWDKSTALITVDSACNCTEELLKNNPIQYISDSLIKMPFGYIAIKNGKGTSNHFIGGYEILIKNWENLDDLDDIIYQDIPFELKTTKVTDLYVEIFAWLNFLDMNIIVIIVMMLIVSLINMVTTLLVVIIEKTNFIGILKAIGATNWSIRKIFIYNALLLLGKGLLWGNIIGIGFIIIQQYFNILPLDPQIYYLDTVPVSFNLVNIFFINILTIITCLIILLIPSYLITKINPVKAIKFN